MTDESGSMPALTLRGVKFGYVADTTVLRSIDLSVNAGEFITVIGQNGSGKSTLVKQFNGLLKPDSGEAIVHDSEGTTYRTADHPMNVLARTVGYVFQNPDDQLFHTKVGEEIEYGLKNTGIPKTERTKRVEQVLDDVGLPVTADANPFSFSKGQRQRLAIAAVLAMEPHVICVDEPTTGQDHTEARLIMDILQEYNDRGHTVITITHDIALASAYTDRVIVVKNGQIIADGPPEQVFLDEANLKETNVRPPQITQLGIRLAETVPDMLEEMWLTTDDAYFDISAALNRPTESDPSVSVEESND